MQVSTHGVPKTPPQELFVALVQLMGSPSASVVQVVSVLSPLL